MRTQVLRGFELVLGGFAVRCTSALPPDPLGASLWDSLIVPAHGLPGHLRVRTSVELAAEFRQE